MVQRARYVLEDDLDHTPATTSIRFGLSGTTYEINLNDQHATQLRETFADWISHARITRQQSSLPRPRLRYTKSPTAGAGADRFQAATELPRRDCFDSVFPA